MWKLLPKDVNFQTPFFVTKQLSQFGCKMTIILDVIGSLDEPREDLRKVIELAVWRSCTSILDRGLWRRVRLPKMQKLISGTKYTVLFTNLVCGMRAIITNDFLEMKMCICALLAFGGMVIRNREISNRQMTIRQIWNIQWANILSAKIPHANAQQTANVY